MRRAFALPLLAVLAACSAEREEPAPAPTPTPTATEPRTLIPADFDPASLGGRVAGIAVEDAAVGGGDDDSLGTVSAYVACAQDIPVCDPAALPDGTVYTYVVTITPAAAPEPDPSATPAATPPPVPLVRPTAPTLAMRNRASGFDGAVGYSRAEATAALGAENALSIEIDQGRIIWRAKDGRSWQGGRPITFWWQSTRPPAEPAVTYDFVSGSDGAEITAPFPAADKSGDGAPMR